MLKFGKKAARPNAVTLKFSDVFNETVMPKAPLVFGHETLLASEDWFMFGNDRYGDCVLAGAAHEHMLWTMEGGGTAARAHFTTADVLSDYSAITGFSTWNPLSDQGTDAQEAAAYRQKTGILDAQGNRHKIDAYASLKVGDLDQLALATWLFGAVGVGVVCADNMEQQFDAGQLWSGGNLTNSGHYVPCVGRNSKGNFLFITWGKLQAATPEWVSKYMDEGTVYLSLEILNASTKLSPESFNVDALQQYLKGISNGSAN